MIKLLLDILVFVINTIYRGRPYPRFYVLETVERVPYFSYLSISHLYETLRFCRRADGLKVDFAESWNELHHLLMMESLEGSQLSGDRILARTTVLLYYWIIVALYIVSPGSAYHFMELVESHAYNSYQKFLTEYETELKLEPTPANLPRKQTLVTLNLRTGTTW
mgnify:FL=1|jgi:hypothetical protein